MTQHSRYLLYGGHRFSTNHRWRATFTAPATLHAPLARYLPFIPRRQLYRQRQRVWRRCGICWTTSALVSPPAPLKTKRLRPAAIYLALYRRRKEGRLPRRLPYPILRVSTAFAMRAPPHRSPLGHPLPRCGYHCASPAACSWRSQAERNHCSSSCHTCCMAALTFGTSAALSAMVLYFSVEHLSRHISAIPACSRYRSHNCTLR